MTHVTLLSFQFLKSEPTEEDTMFDKKETTNWITFVIFMNKKSIHFFLFSKRSLEVLQSLFL